MTTPAPEWQYINVVCCGCNRIGRKFVHTSHLMNYPLSPIDGKRVYMCNTCKHPSTVSEDAPIPHITTGGPDYAERKRTSGGYHSREWRAR